MEQIDALYREIYDLFDSRRKELDIVAISHNYDRRTGRSRASWRRSRQFNVHLQDEQQSTLSTAEVRDRVNSQWRAYGFPDV